MAWLTANWAFVVGLVSGVLGLFALIAKRTKNKKDDEIAGVLQAMWGFVTGATAKKKAAPKPGTKADAPIMTERTSQDEKPDLKTKN